MATIIDNDDDLFGNMLEPDPYNSNITVGGGDPVPVAPVPLSEEERKANHWAQEAKKYSPGTFEYANTKMKQYMNLKNKAIKDFDDLDLDAPAEVEKQMQDKIQEMEELQKKYFNDTFDINKGKKIANLNHDGTATAPVIPNKTAVVTPGQAANAPQNAFKINAATNHNMTRAMLDIVKTIEDEAGLVVDLQTLKDFIYHMEAYGKSPALKKFAQKAAQQMIKTAQAHESKGWDKWRENAKRISGALRTAKESPQYKQKLKSLEVEAAGYITSLPKVAASRAVKIANEAVLEGKRAESIISDIQATGAVTKSRARMIARTEIARSLSQLTHVRAETAGSSEYIWHSSHDGRVREMHEALDGTTQKWDDPPQTEPTGEHSHPGEIWNCRCWAEPIFPEALPTDEPSEVIYEPTDEEIAEETAMKKQKEGEEQEQMTPKAKPMPGRVNQFETYEGPLSYQGSPGGTQGAQIVLDENGERYIFKDYGGNQDRVATEVLSNKLYQLMGVDVPGQKFYKDPNTGQIGLMGTWRDGATEKFIGSAKKKEELGKGYMADAFVGNWDFVGLNQDNILWSNGKPVRLDQGGTLFFRAQGEKKDFGSTPTDVFSMLTQGQAKNGVLIDEKMMREQAKAIAERLTPGKIDALVGSANFKDRTMANTLKTRLKDRVTWYKEFGDGKIPLPIDVKNHLDGLNFTPKVAISDTSPIKGVTNIQWGKIKKQYPNLTQDEYILFAKKELDVKKTAKKNGDGYKGILGSVKPKDPNAVINTTAGPSEPLPDYGTANEWHDHYTNMPKDKWPKDRKDVKDILKEYTNYGSTFTDRYNKNHISAEKWDNEIWDQIHQKGIDKYSAKQQLRSFTGSGYSTIRSDRDLSDSLSDIIEAAADQNRYQNGTLFRGMGIYDERKIEGLTAPGSVIGMQNAPSSWSTNPETSLYDFAFGRGGVPILYVENQTKVKHGVSIASISSVGSGEEEVISSGRQEWKIISRRIVPINNRSGRPIPTIVCEVKELDFPSKYMGTTGTTVKTKTVSAPSSIGPDPAELGYLDKLKYQYKMKKANYNKLKDPSNPLQMSKEELEIEIEQAENDMKNIENGWNINTNKLMSKYPEYAGAHIND